jgi:uncharacterized protein YkwD
MQENSHTKNIVLLAVFIIAIFAVFLLVYKKETMNKAGDPAPMTPLLDPQTPEVKAGSKTNPTPDSHLALTSDNIIWYTNYYRAQHHLEPLTLSIKLRDSAYHKSLDMFKYQYFDHYRPGNGLGFDNFIDNQKYDFIKIGENLAMGDFTTSKEIVDAWIQSTPHRRNILDTTYTEIGVSVDYGVMNGHRSVLITQHFGKPKTTCPTVDQAIKGSIQEANNQLADIKKGIEDRKQTIGSTDPDSSVYESLITDYNNLVTTYNSIADHVAQMVENYNAEATAFDTCVSRE